MALCLSCLVRRQARSERQLQQAINKLHTFGRRSYASQSYYDVLALPRSASQQEIKSKFYELSRKHHPDVSPGATKLFTEINAAYTILRDERARRDYDRTLSTERGPTPSGSGLRSSGLSRRRTRPMGTPSSPYHAATEPKRPAGFGFGDNPTTHGEDVRNQHFEYEQHRSRHSVFDDRYTSRTQEEAAKRRDEAQDNFLARFAGITALVVIVIILTGGISNVRAEERRSRTRNDTCEPIDWHETISRHRRSMEHKLKQKLKE